MSRSLSIKFRKNSDVLFIHPKSPAHRNPYNRRNVNTRENILSWRCNRLHGPIFALARITRAGRPRIKRAREVKRARCARWFERNNRIKGWMLAAAAPGCAVHCERWLERDETERSYAEYGRFLSPTTIDASRSDRIRFRGNRTPGHVAPIT